MGPLAWRLWLWPRAQQVEALHALLAGGQAQLQAQPGLVTWGQQTGADGSITLTATFADEAALQVFVAGPLMSELMAQAPTLLRCPPTMQHA